MTVDDHILDHLIETIKAAGFHVEFHSRILIKGGVVYQGYSTRAQDLKTGERWVIESVTKAEGVYELAEKLGFDLEG